MVLYATLTLYELHEDKTTRTDRKGGCLSHSTKFRSSKDITHRWVYPLVPDNNFFSNTTYSVTRDLNDKEKNVKLSRSSKLEETVIGEGTEVGDNTKISHSIIGRSCSIGIPFLP